MSDVKTCTWEQRIPFIQAKNNQRIYFFRRSYEECNGNNLKSILSAVIEAAEKKYGVTHNAELSEYIAKNSTEASYDPLLVPIFNKKPIDRKSLLDYYERDTDQKHDIGASFVDLCVLLGEIGRAEQFASRIGKNYELLNILRKTDKIQSEVLCQEGIHMWLEKVVRNRDAARLTSLVYRCCGSQEEHKLSPLSELWGEGYYWDAFCLANIMLPNNSSLNFMRDNITQLLKTEDASSIAKLIIEMSKACHEPKGTAFDKNYMRFVDPISLYRIVKVDIIRNEKSDAEELEKLVIRSKCSDAIRHVLLACMIQLGPLEAKAMAADAVAFVSAMGTNLSDFFPHAEKIMFERCVGMVGDIFCAVQHVLGLDGSTTLNFEKEESMGITNIIFSHWKKENPDMWTESGFFARTSCSQTALSLRAYVVALEKLVGIMRPKYNALRLAIRLCWLFTSEDYNKDKDVSQAIHAQAVECGFQDTQQNVITSRFSQQIHEEPQNTVSSSSEHLTGEAFISKFKALGSPSEQADTEKTTFVPISEVTVVDKISEHEKDATVDISLSVNVSTAEEGTTEIADDLNQSVSQVDELDSPLPQPSIISEQSYSVVSIEGDENIEIEDETSVVDTETTQQSSIIEPVIKEGQSAAVDEDDLAKEGSFCSKRADWSAVKHETPNLSQSSVDKTVDTSVDEEIPIQKKTNEDTLQTEGAMTEPKAVDSHTSNAEESEAQSPTANLPLAGPRQNFIGLQQYHEQSLGSAVESPSSTNTSNALDGLLKTNAEVPQASVETIDANQKTSCVAGGDSNASVNSMSTPIVQSQSNTLTPSSNPAPVPTTVSAPARSQTMFNTGGFDTMSSGGFGMSFGNSGNGGGQDYGERGRRDQGRSFDSRGGFGGGRESRGGYAMNDGRHRGGRGEHRGEHEHRGGGFGGHDGRSGGFGRNEGRGGFGGMQRGNGRGQYNQGGHR